MKPKFLLGLALVLSGGLLAAVGSSAEPELAHYDYTFAGKTLYCDVHESDLTNAPPWNLLIRPSRPVGGGTPSESRHRIEIEK
jgi:hypothetical protein